MSHEDTSEKTGSRKSEDRAATAERVAAALRANLKRRKAQTRTRASDTPKD